MKLSNIRIPGVIWALLLIAGGALVEANVDENSLYYQAAMAIIVALIKTLEVNSDDILKWFGKKPEPEPEQERMRAIGDLTPEGVPEYVPPHYRPPGEPRKLTKWLVG